MYWLHFSVIDAAEIFAKASVLNRQSGSSSDLYGCEHSKSLTW
jgi:hypothetical protein